MVFPWRAIKGVKPDALKGASPVLNGGDEETGLSRPRLVATQLECAFSCRYNTRPVQEGLRGGRCAARCRHGQKGGSRCCGRYGASWGLLLRQWRDHGGRVGLRDTSALREGREGAGRGIAEGAEGREEDRQEDVEPLIGFALAHPEQASL